MSSLSVWLLDQFGGIIISVGYTEKGVGVACRYDKGSQRVPIHIENSGQISFNFYKSEPSNRQNLCIAATTVYNSHFLPGPESGHYRQV